MAEPLRLHRLEPEYHRDGFRCWCCGGFLGSAAIQRAGIGWDLSWRLQDRVLVVNAKILELADRVLGRCSAVRYLPLGHEERELGVTWRFYVRGPEPPVGVAQVIIYGRMCLSRVVFDRPRDDIIRVVELELRALMSELRDYARSESIALDWSTLHADPDGPVLEIWAHNGWGRYFTQSVPIGSVPGNHAVDVIIRHLLLAHQVKESTRAT